MPLLECPSVEESLVRWCQILMLCLKSGFKSYVLFMIKILLSKNFARFCRPGVMIRIGISSLTLTARDSLCDRSSDKWNLASL